MKRDEETEERQAYDEMRKKLNESLKRVFRPEFINRLDAVMVFHALSKESLRNIVSLELDKVSQRLEGSEIVLRATPQAIDRLSELGYDPDMGARPLKRVIQQKVEDPLSDALLSGRFEHNDVVMVDLADDEIVLRKAGEDEKTEAAAPEVVAEA